MTGRKIIHIDICLLYTSLYQGAEEHDGKAFGIFAYIEGAEGGDGHNGEFAEHVLLQDAFPGCPHHREADGEIGKQMCIRDSYRGIQIIIRRNISFTFKKKERTL